MWLFYYSRIFVDSLIETLTLQVSELEKDKMKLLESANKELEHLRSLVKDSESEREREREREKDRSRDCITVVGPMFDAHFVYFE